MNENNRNDLNEVKTEKTRYYRQFWNSINPAKFEHFRLAYIILYFYQE